PTFLFSRMRHPPISTLFPYTTLFRSRAHAVARRRADPGPRVGRPPRGPTPTPHQPKRAAAGRAPSRPSPRRAPSQRGTRATAIRSEEHTSELQSLAYLVCRPLLEKTN